MAEIIQYGFQDKDGEYDEAVFPDTEYEKALEYAKRHKLLLVEDRYEWQETIEKDDFREKAPTTPQITGQIELAADEIAEE